MTSNLENAILDVRPIFPPSFALSRSHPFSSVPTTTTAGTPRREHRVLDHPPLPRGGARRGVAAAAAAAEQPPSPGPFSSLIPIPDPSPVSGQRARSSELNPPNSAGSLSGFDPPSPFSSSPSPFGQCNNSRSYSKPTRNPTPTQYSSPSSPNPINPRFHSNRNDPTTFHNNFNNNTKNPPKKPQPLLRKSKSKTNLNPFSKSSKFPTATAPFPPLNSSYATTIHTIPDANWESQRSPGIPTTINVSLPGLHGNRNKIHPHDDDGLITQQHQQRPRRSSSTIETKNSNSSSYGHSHHHYHPHDSSKTPHYPPPPHRKPHRDYHSHSPQFQSQKDPNIISSNSNSHSHSSSTHTGPKGVLSDYATRPRQTGPKGVISDWREERDRVRGEPKRTGPKGVIEDWRRGGGGKWASETEKTGEEKDEEEKDDDEFESDWRRKDGEGARRGIRQGGLVMDLQGNIRKPNDDDDDDFLLPDGRTSVDGVSGSNRRKVYGHLREVGEEGMLERVEKSGEGEMVVVCFYEPSSPLSPPLLRHLSLLARCHPTVQFLRLNVSSSSRGNNNNNADRLASLDLNDDDDGGGLGSGLGIGTGTGAMLSAVEALADPDVLPSLIVYRSGQLSETAFRVGEPSNNENTTTFSSSSSLSLSPQTLIESEVENVTGGLRLTEGGMMGSNGNGSGVGAGRDGSGGGRWSAGSLPGGNSQRERIKRPEIEALSDDDEVEDDDD